MIVWFGITLDHHLSTHPIVTLQENAQNIHKYNPVYVCCITILNLLFSHEADVLINKLKGLDEDMFGHLLKRAVNQGDLRACPVS